MLEQFAVKVFFRRATNHDPVQVLDLCRRQADYLGRLGIEAKRGQKGVVMRRRRSLRLSFSTRKLAQAYQARVALLSYNEVETKRFRVLQKPRRTFIFGKSPRT